MQYRNTFCKYFKIKMYEQSTGLIVNFQVTVTLFYMNTSSIKVIMPATRIAAGDQ